MNGSSNYEDISQMYSNVSPNPSSFIPMNSQYYPQPFVPNNGQYFYDHYNRFVKFPPQITPNGHPAFARSNYYPYHNQMPVCSSLHPPPPQFHNNSRTFTSLLTATITTSPASARSDSRCVRMAIRRRNTSSTDGDWVKPCRRKPQPARRVRRR